MLVWIVAIDPLKAVSVAFIWVRLSCIWPMLV